MKASQPPQRGSTPGGGASVLPQPKDSSHSQQAPATAKARQPKSKASSLPPDAKRKHTKKDRSSAEPASALTSAASRHPNQSRESPGLPNGGQQHRKSGKKDGAHNGSPSSAGAQKPLKPEAKGQRSERKRRSPSDAGDAGTKPKQAKTGQALRPSLVSLSCSTSLNVDKEIFKISFHRRYPPAT